MNKEEKLVILEKLVSFNTSEGNELAEAQYLQDLLLEHGIESEIENLGNHEANLIAEIGTDKPVFTISGHLDTVAVDVDKWDTDPFTLVRKDAKCMEVVY